MYEISNFVWQKSSIFSLLFTYICDGIYTSELIVLNSFLLCLSLGLCSKLLVQFLASFELKLTCRLYWSWNCFCVAQPSKPLSFLPFTLAFCLTNNINLVADTVLKVVLPLARVLLWSRHAQSSQAIFLTINEITDVFTSISPNFLTFTLNDTVYKLTIVSFLLILEVVFSYAMENSILKISFIIASICPIESSFAIFFIREKRANKSWSISSPCLNTCSVKSVIKPLAFVSVTL